MTLFHPFRGTVNDLSLELVNHRDREVWFARVREGREVEEGSFREVFRCGGDLTVGEYLAKAHELGVSEFVPLLPGAGLEIGGYYLDPDERVYLIAFGEQLG